MIPTHATHFDGDPAECVKWLGYARGVLQQMVRDNNPAVKSKHLFIDDAEIWITKNPNAIRIKISNKMSVTFLRTNTNGHVPFLSDAYKKYDLASNDFIRKNELFYNRKYTGGSYWIDKSKDNIIHWISGIYYATSMNHKQIVFKGATPEYLIACAIDGSNIVCANFENNGFGRFNFYIERYSIEYKIDSDTYEAVQSYKRKVTEKLFVFSFNNGVPSGNFLSDKKTLVFNAFEQYPEGTALYKYEFNNDFSSNTEQVIASQDGGINPSWIINNNNYLGLGSVTHNGGNYEKIDFYKINKDFSLSLGFSDIPIPEKIVWTQYYNQELDIRVWCEIEELGESNGMYSGGGYTGWTYPCLFSVKVSNKGNVFTVFQKNRDYLSVAYLSEEGLIKPAGELTRARRFDYDSSIGDNCIAVAFCTQPADYAMFFSYPTVNTVGVVIFDYRNNHFEVISMDTNNLEYFRNISATTKYEQL